MSESEQPRTRRRDDVTDVEMVGGVEKRDLCLLDYDPDWARQFAEHEAWIREALSGKDFGVEHIGSTSMPGLAAKPIIDIPVTVARHHRRGGLPRPAARRRLCPSGARAGTSPGADARTGRARARPRPDDPAADDYLLLRDRLCTDETDRSLYESTKRQLLQGVDTWYGQATTTPGQVTNAAKDRAKAEAQANADFGPGAVASARRLRNTVSGNPIGPVEPYLCHAVCDIGATKWTPAMSDVTTWLKDHPREVITFFVEDSVSAADTAKVFESAGLLPYVATHTPGQPWPTLRQMIDSGKRVVVLMQRDGGGEQHPWLLQGWDQAQDTNYDAKSPEQLSCARNRGTDKSQLLLINNWLNNFDRVVTDAAQVNAYDSLYPRMLRCQKERGMIPNFIAVNYYNRGDLFDVVNSLNGVQ